MNSYYGNFTIVSIDDYDTIVAVLDTIVETLATEGVELAYVVKQQRG